LDNVVHVKVITYTEYLNSKGVLFSPLHTHIVEFVAGHGEERVSAMFL